MSTITYKQRLNRVRKEIEARYQYHLGCLKGTRDDKHLPIIQLQNHYAVKNELFELSCFMDVLENAPELLQTEQEVEDLLIEKEDKVAGRDYIPVA